MNLAIERKPTVAVIFTGFSPRPSRVALDEFRNTWPEVNFTGHVFTWSNWNIVETRRAFEGEIIYEFDLNNFRSEIDAVTHLFPFNAPESNPSNVVSMFRLWKICAEHIHNIEADYFIKLRVDDTLYYNNHKCGINDSYRGLSVPSGGDYRGGIGDHVAFGGRDSVLTYLKIFDALGHMASSNEVLHPEMLLRKYLISVSNNVVRRVPIVIFCKDYLYNYQMHENIYFDRSSNNNDVEDILRISSKLKSYACRSTQEGKVKIFLKYLLALIRFHMIKIVKYITRRTSL